MTELADEPTVRGPGRPRDASRDRAILAAALQILQEEGYRGLTIDGVAARAGVGRPTIYRRWPSKPALVVAALVEAAELALPVRDTGSLRGDLIAVQRRQVALMNSPESRRVTAGLVADLAADPELAERYVSQYLAPRRALVWQVLQRGIDRGELDPDADLAFCKRTVGPCSGDPPCGRRSDSVAGGRSTADRWNPQVWHRERHWDADPFRRLHLHKPIRERQCLRAPDHVRSEGRDSPLARGKLDGERKFQRVDVQDSPGSKVPRR